MHAYIICIMLILIAYIHYANFSAWNMLFPDIPVDNFLTSSNLCSNISFSIKPTPISLFIIATYPHQHPWASLSCCLFCCCIKPSKTHYKMLVISWQLRQVEQGSESLVGWAFSSGQSGCCCLGDGVGSGF